MSRTKRTIFSAIREGFRNGKLTVVVGGFAIVGIIAGPDWTDDRTAELSQRDDCTPVVWQDAWTGTERESAWQTLIEQGWHLRNGTNYDLIVPPNCESADIERN